MGTESLLTERFRRADEDKTREWLKQLALEQAAPKEQYGPPSPTSEQRQQQRPTIANEKAGQPAAIYDPARGWVLSSDPTVRVRPNGALDLLGMATAAAGARFVEGQRSIARGLAGKSEPVLGSQTLGELTDVAVGALQSVFFPSAAASYLTGEAGEALVRWSGELSDEVLQARLKHARLHAPGEVPFIEAMLTRPYEERVAASRAGFANEGEVGSGFVPAYTLGYRGVAALVSRRAKDMAPVVSEAVTASARQAQLALNPTPAPAGAPTPFDTAVEAAPGRQPGQRPFNKQRTPQPAGAPTALEDALPPERKAGEALRDQTGAMRLTKPAIFRGEQERLSGPPIRLFNLAEDVVDEAGNVLHPTGSTVAEATLQKYGVPYDAPAPTLRPEAAQAVVEQTLRPAAEGGGGATLDPRRGALMTPDSGYAVGVHPERSEIIPIAELTPERVQQFAAKNADVLTDGRYVGTWVADDGVHLDISAITPTKDEAWALAGPRERAIWGFAEGQEFPGDPLRLEHYSTREGLDLIDPAFFGHGQAGRERARASEPGFLPRTYAYTVGAKPEARFNGSPFKYDLEVPAHSIYDYRTDPKGLVAQAAADGPAGAATRAEALIQAAGFRGYRVDDVVALFEPTPVAGVTVRVPGTNGQALNVRLDEAQRRLRASWLDVAKRILADETGALSLRGAAGEPGWAKKNGEVWNDLAIVGAGYLYTGARSFRAWSALMLPRFGAVIEPELKTLYEASQKRLAGMPVKRPRSFGALEKLEAQGAYARDWYDGALDAAIEAYGPVNGPLYLRLYAALSPQTPADTLNFQLADEAFRLIVSGKRQWPDAPFTREDVQLYGFIPGTHTDNLNRVLRGEELSGPKVSEFEPALFGDVNAVPFDSWMSRAFGWSDFHGMDERGRAIFSKVEVTRNRALFGKEVVTHLANKVGVEPRGAQAAIWAAFKVQYDSKFSIKPWTELFSIWRKADEIGMAKPSFIRDLDDLPEPSWVTEGVRGQGGFLKLGAASDEEGWARLGLMYALSRAAVGAALAGATGDDPESMAMSALIGAGLGYALGPAQVRKLARVTAEVVQQPDVREAFSRAWAVASDETGAMNLRFPRGVHASPAGREPSPNTGRMGVSDEAKRLVRGINEKLEAARKLSRAAVVSHDETIQAALKSEYSSLENVLKLDAAKLTPDQLPAVRTAARGVRDFVLEDTLEAFAQARLAGDPELARAARQKFALAGRVSQQVTDLETWIARAQEAGKITSHPRKPQPVDLDGFARELADIDATLASRLSDDQLVAMVTEMTDRARLRRLAEAGSRWPAALQTIYYGLNLLSSPLTHFKNILGTGGGMTLALADRAVAEGVELVTLPFVAAGLKNRNIAFGETYELARGYFEMIADSFRAGKEGALQKAAESFRTGESSLGGAFKSSEGLAVVRDTLDEKDTLPAVIRVMAMLAEKNLRFMGSTDEFYKVLAFHGETRALARRRAMVESRGGKDFVEQVRHWYDNPDTDILAQAKAFADENTFTKQFERTRDWQHLGGLGAQAQDFAGNPVMRVLVTPFFRTPTRLGEFTMTHTPVLNALAVQFWSDLAEGGAKAQLAFAKIVTGAGVMGLASWYAAHGTITGDWPTDPGLRASYERAGWQPRSIYNWFNGKYYSYAGLEPLSTLLATAANYVQLSQQLPEAEVQQLALAATIAAAKGVFDNPYFQGVSDVGDVIEGFERGESPEALMKALTRRVAGLVPFAALGRLGARMGDDVKRERQTVEHTAPEWRDVDIAVNVFKEMVPGWSKTRPAVLNMITGEPIPAEGGWLGKLLPFQVTTNRNDVVLNELVALHGAGLPREVPRVIGGAKPPDGVRMQPPRPGEGVRLSDVERQRLTELLTRDVKDGMGRTLYEALHAMIAGPGIEHTMYEDASDGRDGGKAQMVQQTFHDFLETAEVELKHEFPQLGEVIERRRFERDLGRLPKSQEAQKPMLRELFQSITR